MSIGDLLVLLGIAVTWWLYQLQARSSEQRGLLEARDLLKGTLTSLDLWDLYFKDGWDNTTAPQRAAQDFDWIMHGTYGEIFPMPPQQLVALINHPEAGGLISARTIAAASAGLWKVTTFNELVRQKTDFNGRYLVEIIDENLPPRRREMIAKAAAMQSQLLHGSAIGDTSWFRELKESLEANVDDLNGRLERPWWKRVYLLIATLAAMLVLAAAGVKLALVASDSSGNNQLPPAYTSTTAVLTIIK